MRVYILILPGALLVVFQRHSRREQHNSLTKQSQAVYETLIPPRPSRV